MGKSVRINLKSGKFVDIDKFKYLTYPSSEKTLKVTAFENFYLYDRLLTFVGETSIVTLNSNDIEFIEFDGNFSE